MDREFGSNYIAPAADLRYGYQAGFLTAVEFSGVFYRLISSLRLKLFHP